MDRANPPSSNEASSSDARTHAEPSRENVPRGDHVAEPTSDREGANPPHTTTGKITSPKFGSAGSGGAELEPGLDRD